MTDNVNSPKHYNQHPAGVECIDVVEHMTANLAAAVKYCWRSDERLGNQKGNVIEDLKKSIWYINREIERIEKSKKGFYATATSRSINRSAIRANHLVEVTERDRGSESGTGPCSE